VQESRRAETGSDHGPGPGSGSRACTGSTGRSGDKVRKVSIVTKKEPAEHRCSAGFFLPKGRTAAALAQPSPMQKKSGQPA